MTEWETKGETASGSLLELIKRGFSVSSILTGQGLYDEVRSLINALISFFGSDLTSTMACVINSSLQFKCSSHLDRQVRCVYFMSETDGIYLQQPRYLRLVQQSLWALLLGNWGKIMKSLDMKFKYLSDPFDLRALILVNKKFTAFPLSTQQPFLAW